jgi:hypothetical protein
MEGACALDKFKNRHWHLLKHKTKCTIEHRKLALRFGVAPSVNELHQILMGDLSKGLDLNWECQSTL